MKKYIATSIFLLLCFLLKAQSPFQELTFNQALEQAKKDSQLVMVQLFSRNCIQCNDVAVKGMEQQSFREQLEKGHVIALVFNEKDRDWQTLSQKYNAANGLALLFFSPSGQLIHQYRGSTSLTSTYITQLDIAQKNMADEKAIGASEKAYASGSRNPDLLKQIINFRKNTGRDFGMVLDDYAKALPSDSLKSISTILYIAGNAPVLGSYADSIMRFDPDRFKEAWYLMDLETRITINNRVIDKSLNIAIVERNRHKATSVAYFSAQTNSKNSPAYGNAFNQVMSRYYRNINDTLNYFMYATTLYDGYYMKLNIDSVKKKDSLTIKQMLLDAPPDEHSANYPPQKRSTGVSSVQYRKSINFISPTQYIASDLNNGAFSFYTMRADSTLTKKALQWASRSMEFNETPQNLDTYARLLYKSGKTDSAIYYQKKAVELQAKTNFPSSEIENVLKKMMKGEIKIDEYCCELQTAVK